jgi:hypothetical protein
LLFIIPGSSCLGITPYRALYRKAEEPSTVLINPRLGQRETVRLRLFLARENFTWLEPLYIDRAPARLDHHHIPARISIVRRVESRHRPAVNPVAYIPLHGPVSVRLANLLVGDSSAPVLL